MRKQGASAQRALVQAPAVLDPGTNPGRGFTEKAQVPGQHLLHRSTKGPEPGGP